jgi:hypothetical protein
VSRIKNNIFLKKIIKKRKEKLKEYYKRIKIRKTYIDK